MRKILRAAAVLTAALAALTACAPATAPASTTAPSASTAADAAFPVTIEHAMGSTTIESRPLRIVALDPSYVDATLLLGGQLVGYAQYRADPEHPFPDYLGDVSALTAEAVNVGTIAEPNLEQIAALKPDLIISAKVRQEALYPQLASIAPTVFSVSTGPTWKENVVLLGRAMGEQEKAESLVADYEERAAAIGADIMAKNPGLTYSLVRFAGEDTVRLYSSKSYIGEIMADAGIPRPAGAPDTTEQIFVPLSQEQILSADAGLVLVSKWKAAGAEEAKAVEDQAAAFTSNPLWSRFTGELVEVDDSVFVSSVSIQGAHAVLTQLAEKYGVDARLS